MSGFKNTSLILSHNISPISPSLSGDMTLIARNGRVVINDGSVENNLAYYSEIESLQTQIDSISASDLSNYTLISTTAAISASLQSQIDNISGGSSNITINPGVGIQIIESPVDTFTISVSGDFITSSEVTSISAGLNSRIVTLEGNPVPDIFATEVASISSGLQSQIDNIVQESTSIGSSGGSITVTANGDHYNLEVATAPIANHNDLSGLQGGTTGEYYHLTSNQFTDYIGSAEVEAISSGLWSFTDAASANALTHANAYTDLVASELSSAISGALGNVISFTNADLVSSVLTVNHDLYDIHVVPVVYDNTNELITPDNYEVASGVINVDLSSYSPITGTWHLTIINTIGSTTVTSSSGSTDHNDFGGLQGGTTDEYYHLTSSQFSDYIGRTEVASASANALAQANAYSDSLEPDLSAYALTVTVAAVSAGLDSRLDIVEAQAVPDIFRTEVASVSAYLQSEIDGIPTPDLSPYALNSQVVHNTGAETISGNKSFIDSVSVNGSLTTLGNIGIGTTNPIGKLVVADETNGKGLEVSISSISGGNIIIEAYDRTGANYIPARYLASSHSFEQGNTSFNGNVTINDSYFLRVPSEAPATSGDAGTIGSITWDNDYVYVCTGTNTWKKAPLSLVGYNDGVDLYNYTLLSTTSAISAGIQTQINAKQDTITGGATTITSSNLTASRAIASDGSGKVAVSATTSTELGYVNGVTSSIQTQINSLIPGINWVSRTSAANELWVSVAYGNGIYVSVAYNAIMSSPDGVNWTSRTSPTTGNWTSVCYGNGLFVAVSTNGTGNRVMTSPDGITWTLRTSAADNEWYAVCFGNGLFVAVASSGTNNRVMTSPDGITWTLRTSAADNEWRGVCFGNGLFVAVSQDGSGNRVMTSPNGITWTSRTSAANNIWSSVTYANGLFVAVANSGSSNRAMTSPDGINWTIRTTPANSNNWNSVCFGNGLFVAVAYSGSSNQVMTSPDGITWTSRNAPTVNNWNSVCFGNGLFVAVAYTGSGNRVMNSGKQNEQLEPLIPGSAIADVTGGATVDAEARSTLNDLLAELRIKGIIGY